MISLINKDPVSTLMPPISTWGVAILQVAKWPAQAKEPQPQTIPIWWLNKTYTLSLLFEKDWWIKPPIMKAIDKANNDKEIV